MYVLDTASAAYVHDKTFVRCNGATPVLLFSGVTFMIGAESGGLPGTSGPGAGSCQALL